MSVFRPMATKEVGILEALEERPGTDVQGLLFTSLVSGYLFDI